MAPSRRLLAGAIVLALSTVTVACSDARPAGRSHDVADAGPAPTSRDAAHAGARGVPATSSAAPLPVGAQQRSGDSRGRASSYGTRPSGTRATYVPRPAAPGTYVYRQSGEQRTGSRTAPAAPQAKLVVDAARVAGSGTWTQDWHQYADMTSMRQSVRYRLSPAGFAWWSRLTGTSSKDAVLCEFNPPVVVVPAPLRIGYRFASRGVCSAPTPLLLSGRVTGTVTTTLGGAEVTALVVTMTVSEPGAGQSVAETVWFDPALGLDVREEITTSGGSGPDAWRTRLIRTLVSGTPR